MTEHLASQIGATLSQEHIKELVELAEGYEASDYAETLLAKALQPHRDAFNRDERDTVTMRQLRIQLDAEANARRSRRSAAAIRAALAALSSES